MARHYRQDACVLDLAFWEDPEILDCQDLSAIATRVSELFPYEKIKVLSLSQLLMQPDGRTKAGLRWMPSSIRDIICHQLPRFAEVFFTLCGYYGINESMTRRAHRTHEFMQRSAGLAVNWFNDFLTLEFPAMPPKSLLVGGGAIRGFAGPRLERRRNDEFFQRVRGRWLDAGTGKLTSAEIHQGELHLDICWNVKPVKIEEDEFYPALFLSNAEIRKIGCQAVDWGWYSPTLEVFGPLRGPATSQGDFLHSIDSLSYRAADKAVTDWIKSKTFNRQLQAAVKLRDIPVVGSYEDLIRFWRASAYSSAYGLVSIDTAIGKILQEKNPTAFDLYLEICRGATQHIWRARRRKFNILRKFIEKPERWV